MKFKNKKVLVVGFGASGRAAVRFLQGEGARVAVTDAGYPREVGGGGNTRRREPQGMTDIEFHFGGHPPEIFLNRDLIVVSPGIPLDLPGIRLASRRRTPVTGEFGLACRLLRSPMIAVTGTNGKSTTVTLIARILEKAGFATALAGNIGRPLLEVVMEGKKLDWVVAEVSSYQLESAGLFHPKIGVLLNITEDHLDRYRSFRDYARAKFRLFEFQGPRDLLIYKEDDPVVRGGIRRARSKKIGFSLEPIRKTPLYRSGSSLFFRWGRDLEEYPINRVRLAGLHNLENMMASVGTARFAGASSKTIQGVLETFEGLPHRTEFVREVRSVRYYDDSKGTNVDAVVKSLAGFPDRRVILIAGGQDKGGSYYPLRSSVKKKVKLLILYGEARDRIAQVMKGVTEVVTRERIDEAVSLASRKAVSGEIVLLSPACSSFDQFRDYKERGDLFQKLVREL